MTEPTHKIRRVKYYSADDMSCGLHLERAEKVIEQYNNETAYVDINQMIEFYNIKSFFEKGIFYVDGVRKK